jgi:ATP-binding cassette subfamily C (CFTR/MRP) protein 1
VEAKRLDSILRSNVYAAVSGQLRSQTYEPILKLNSSESLSGLATVRAYRDEERFISKLDNGIDGESYFLCLFWMYLADMHAGQNRAYYMTIILQQWLGIRLDVRFPF